MRILVVDYCENHKRIEDTEIISNIVSFYEKSEEATKEEMGHLLRSQLSELSDCHFAEIVRWEPKEEERHKLLQYVESRKPDLLVSYALSGFELTTLTEGLLYNLMDVRQIHFLQNEFQFKRYEMPQKSINLFCSKLY